MVTTMSATHATQTDSRSCDPAATPFNGNLPLIPEESGNGAAFHSGGKTLPDELDLFHDFTERHLRPLANGDVQCMLIWAEWVRYHLRLTKNFPRLILEAEFSYLITGLFNTKMALDLHRGRIYSGVQYIP